MPNGGPQRYYGSKGAFSEFRDRGSKLLSLPKLPPKFSSVKGGFATTVGLFA